MKQGSARKCVVYTKYEENLLSVFVSQDKHLQSEFVSKTGTQKLKVN